MKISTGLRPAAEQLRVHRRRNDAGLYYVETAEWSSPIVLPSGAAEVWIVTFYKDKEAVRVLVLEKEPAIKARRVQWSSPGEYSAWYAGQDKVYRERHSVPDDALVSKNRYILAEVVDTTYEWYELTV